MSLNTPKTTRKALVKTIALANVLSAMSVSANEFRLEEIVVTAQKRSQSLQDVPISVSAVGGEKLAEAGIENLRDLSTYVPNLKVIEGALVPQMFIRGIGSSANQGFEQSVGTYSDGVYMGRSLQSRSSFLDLERVEVLRGPQGILFGQSTIAGAISLVSAKPSQEFDALISASIAPEYDETEISGYVSGPLTETISARLALRDRREGGYLENDFLNEDSMDLDEQAGRLSVQWEPNHDFSAHLKIESAQVDRKGRLDQPIALGGYPAIFPGLVEDGRLDYHIRSNEETEMSFDSSNLVLTMEYNWGENTLTSISSYSEYEYTEDNFDPDATEVQVLSMDMYEDFDQFSQEIRISSLGGETIDYIAGLFYQSSNQEYLEDVNAHLSNLGLEPAPGFPALDTLIDRDFSQESETLAAFAQVTWNINDQLRATFGLRYSQDEKEGARDQVLYSLAIAPGTPQSAIAIPGTPFTAADLLALEDDGDVNPLPDGLRADDHNLRGKLDEDNWTPSINIQYDLNEDVMLYLTYSEGYKSGGFDARGINGVGAGDLDPVGRSYGPFAQGAENFFYDQEEAETIELGAKMTLLDGAADLNVALFSTDYTDMQVSVYDGTFGFAVLNAGESTVRGLELDGRWRASENLVLTAALAYLDFEWKDYQEGPCPGAGHNSPSPSGSGNCVYDGLENNHTPEWTVNLGASHTYPISENLELRSALDLNFKDNHYVANNLDTRSEQAGTTLINARLALASLDDTWQVALMGKNLTDQETINYATELILSGGGITAQIGRPRTLALEASYRF